LILCNLVWGCQFVIYKIVQQQSGPVFAARLLTTIATLLMAPVVGRRHKTAAGLQTPLPTGDVLQFLLIGVCGQVAAQVGVATGSWLTMASNAALLALPLPIVTALMAYVFLGERMTGVCSVCFALAFSGDVMCADIRWSELNFTSSKYLLGNMIFSRPLPPVPSTLSTVSGCCAIRRSKSFSIAT
jgi:drug/metabolite transporter (DMT)-like permease